MSPTCECLSVNSAWTDLNHVPQNHLGCWDHLCYRLLNHSLNRLDPFALDPNHHCQTFLKYSQTAKFVKIFLYSDFQFSHVLPYPHCFFKSFIINFPCMIDFLLACLNSCCQGTYILANKSRRGANGHLAKPDATPHPHTQTLTIWRSQMQPH